MPFTRPLNLISPIWSLPQNKAQWPPAGHVMPERLTRRPDGVVMSYNQKFDRRRDREAEGAPLLREYAVMSCIEGSNPSVSARTPSVPLPARKVREPRQAGLLLLATNTLKPTPACLRSSSVAAFREITWHSMTSCRHRQHLIRRRPATPPCGRGSQSNHARRRSADAECPAARLARWGVVLTALAGHRPSA